MGRTSPPKTQSSSAYPFCGRPCSPAGGLCTTGSRVPVQCHTCRTSSRLRPRDLLVLASFSLFSTREAGDLVSQLCAAAENCSTPYQERRWLIVPHGICAVEVESIPLNLSFVVARECLLEPAPNFLRLVP